MSKIFILVVFLFTYSLLDAQENYNNGKSVTIQTDLMDPMAKGASLWLNFDMNKQRLFSAVGFNELPDFLNAKKDDFSEKRDWFVQLGYGYRLGKKENWIAGVQMIYKDLTAISKSTNEEKDLKVLRTCPIVFYEWKFIKSQPRLSLTPWASYRIDVLNQKAVFPIAQKEYSSAKGNFAMGINLGYKFGK